jgi:hypothetical protein
MQAITANLHTAAAAEATHHASARQLQATYPKTHMNYI